MRTRLERHVGCAFGFALALDVDAAPAAVAAFAVAAFAVAAAAAVVAVAAVAAVAAAAAAVVVGKYQHEANVKPVGLRLHTTHTLVVKSSPNLKASPTAI